MFAGPVSVRLGQFVERSFENEFAYWKPLGTGDAHLFVSHTLQSTLESWQEAGIVPIDLYASFDCVNQGILYKFFSGCWQGWQVV